MKEVNCHWSRFGAAVGLRATVVAPVLRYRLMGESLDEIRAERPSASDQGEVEHGLQWRERYGKEGAVAAKVEGMGAGQKQVGVLGELRRGRSDAGSEH